MALSISASVKGVSSDSSSTEGKVKLSHRRSFVRLGGAASIAEKCACIISCFSWWDTAQPGPTRNRCMKFFRRLPFARRWKYSVLASPSFKFVALAHCLFRALSITAHPNTFFLSFALIRNSASFSSLFSWAMSNCIMTCCAIRSFNLTSEMIEELQDLRALAVRKSLCPRRWKGSVWEAGAFQAACAVCSNRGSLVQKFSNLNGVGRRGPDCCAKSNGQ